MSFDDLASALVKRFASGATNWRLRQTIAQRVQLENESMQITRVVYENSSLALICLARTGCINSFWLKERNL